MWAGSEQAGGERIPLLPGEVILNSYAGRGGRYYATDKRLLFHARKGGQDSYRDLSYGEITSVALEPSGRSVSGLAMTAVFFVGAFVVFVLSQTISSTQAVPIFGEGGISAGTARFVGFLLSIAALLWGAYRLLDFLSGVRRYILAGPGLLREARYQALWEIPLDDKGGAAASEFVQTVREQALRREVDRQVLVDVDARLAAMSSATPNRTGGDAGQLATGSQRPRAAEGRQIAFPVFARPPWMMESEERSSGDLEDFEADSGDIEGSIKEAYLSAPDAVVEADKAPDAAKDLYPASNEVEQSADAAGAEPRAEAEEKDGLGQKSQDR
jgi:hypothetical protein